MQLLIYKEVEVFIQSCEKRTIAKILRSIDLLVEFEKKLGTPHVKQIEKGLFELRVRGHQEVRIFYMIHRNNIILIHGILKKTQKIPRHEIRKAIKRKKTIEKE